MGGYGALKCALRRPDQYAGAAAFSAVMDANDFCTACRPPEACAPARLPPYSGPANRSPPPRDLFALLGAADPAALPRLFWGAAPPTGCGP